MIVDLMRNDLGRVCEPGTIEVHELAAPHPAPGVWHLISTVGGILRAETGDSELLRAAFPLVGDRRPEDPGDAGDLRARGDRPRVLHRRDRLLEPARRPRAQRRDPHLEPERGPRLARGRGRDRRRLGARGGAARVHAQGRPDHRRGRRPALLGEPAPRATARVAAGLALAERPDPARGVFETILVRDGLPVNADAHLDRLERSIDELYGCSLPVDTAERLAVEAVSRPLARLRVIAVPARGEVEVAVTADAVRGEAGSAVALRPFAVPGGLGAHKWNDRRLVAALAGDGGTLPLIVDLDGAALEAGHANLFVAEGDRLLTPALDGRLLPGTVRAELLASLRPLGVEVVEQPLTLDRVAVADAILLSSSIRGLRAARLERSRARVGLAAGLRQALAEVGYPLDAETAPPATIGVTGGRSSSTRIT